MATYFKHYWLTIHTFLSLRCAKCIQVIRQIHSSLAPGSPPFTNISNLCEGRAWHEANCINMDISLLVDVDKSTTVVDGPFKICVGYIMRCRSLTDLHNKGQRLVKRLNRSRVIQLT